MGSGKKTICSGGGSNSYEKAFSAPLICEKRILASVGKFWVKDYRGEGPPPPPTPLIFAKITIVDLSETGSWTYRKLVRGPIGNRFVDLSETGLWIYRKPVCGPFGNRFVPGAKRCS